VLPAQEADVAHFGTTPVGMRPDVVELQARPLFAALPIGSGECTLSLIALPHGSPYVGGNISRAMCRSGARLRPRAWRRC